MYCQMSSPSTESGAYHMLFLLRNIVVALGPLSAYNVSSHDLVIDPALRLDRTSTV